MSKIPEEIFPVVLSDGTPVMQITPRLSILEAVQFKKTYQELLQLQPTPEQIVLDFESTRFIDSSGVGSLISNLKAGREKGVELILTNVHPPVMGVLNLTGLDRVLRFQASSPSLAHSHSGENYLPATHPSVQSWVKRGLDIVGSIVGLGITGIAFVPIAIAIKLDSPGPIFFGQTRCGWLGKEFKIWKFRSMCLNAESLKHQVKNEASGAFFKNEQDFRITQVGRFLRRTSLDELPQFWNVLRGEMSLVGTRPPTPAEVETYQIPEWQRLDVKPGMTGEWQVNGRSKIRNFEDVIKLDLRYQENWSLIYDIKLILKTIWILFRKNSGAV